MKSATKKIFRLAIWAAALGIIAIAACYTAVSVNAWGRTYDDASLIPHRATALLLGTSPITRQGDHNYYFDTRIHAAAHLYHTGKIDHIIASGGNYADQQLNGCNELEAMRDSLVNRGVPDSIITLDYGGLRTLNSIVNVKSMGIDSITIISQHYHNERALLLADSHDVDAIAYNATLPTSISKRVKNFSREFLARVKVWLDIIFQQQQES